MTQMRIRPRRSLRAARATESTPANRLQASDTCGGNERPAGEVVHKRAPRRAQTKTMTWHKKAATGRASLTDSGAAAQEFGDLSAGFHSWGKVNFVGGIVLFSHAKKSYTTVGIKL